VHRLGLLLALALPQVAGAVTAVFDPAGPSFYDLPFPHELRRDADGTVSLAGFPNPSGSALVASYLASMDETEGFGRSSGVFFKLDGAIDPASLPADAEASRAADASVFLVDVDPGSPARGQRVPLWMQFRAVGDAYRDHNLLGLMPVPGHQLAADTLYAAVVTDAVEDPGGMPLSRPPAMARLVAGTPSGDFETEALPLYDTLFDVVPREHVVVATVFRTGDPARTMEAVARYVRRIGKPEITQLRLDATRSTGTFWTFLGRMRAPQFQAGPPPFSAPGSGAFVFDDQGRPVPQRHENLEFVLCIPKERDDGSLVMPPRGWPIVASMHGTGGSRFSLLSGQIAARLAAQGIASFSIDQPLHGSRAGGTADGNGFYNPLNPAALRDNPLQAAGDSLVIHELFERFSVPAALVTAPPGTGFTTPSRTIRFDRRHRLVMGHSQGATTLPLFLGVARGAPGGVLSAGGGHLLVNILTREAVFFAGQKLRDLVQLLLGGPIDLFHPALHLLQMSSEVSDPITFAPLWTTRRGGPASVLCTHGTADGFVTTPMTASMAIAARIPLIAPTVPNVAFPLLPGYSYQEGFDLAGLPTLPTPASATVGRGRRAATSGMTLYEGEGHFPVFDDPDAIAQWTGFMRTLAYDPVATIPPRP
jgi:hypothetical protein